MASAALCPGAASTVVHKNCGTRGRPHADLTRRQLHGRRARSYHNIVGFSFGNTDYILKSQSKKEKVSIDAWKSHSLGETRTGTVSASE